MRRKQDSLMCQEYQFINLSSAFNSICLIQFSEDIWINGKNGVFLQENFYWPKLRLPLSLQGEHLIWQWWSVVNKDGAHLSKAMPKTSSLQVHGQCWHIFSHAIINVAESAALLLSIFLFFTSYTLFWNAADRNSSWYIICTFIRGGIKNNGLFFFIFQCKRKYKCDQFK